MNAVTLGTISFGLVWIVSYYAKKWFKFEFDTTTKLLLQGVLFFALLFVPTNLTNDLLNKLELTIGAVAGVTALYQGPKAIITTAIKQAKGGAK